MSERLAERIRAAERQLEDDRRGPSVQPAIAISIEVRRHDGATLTLDARQIAAVLEALQVDEDTRYVRTFLINAEADPFGRRLGERPDWRPA